MQLHSHCNCWVVRSSLKTLKQEAQQGQENQQLAAPAGGTGNLVTSVPNGRCCTDVDQLQKMHSWVLSCRNYVHLHTYQDVRNNSSCHIGFLMSFQHKLQVFLQVTHSNCNNVGSGTFTTNAHLGNYHHYSKRQQWCTTSRRSCAAKRSCCECSSDSSETESCPSFAL